MGAVRNNKNLKAFYEKLTNNRKLKMVAIVAVMRKLLVSINNRCKQYYLDKAYMLT
jgi:hypothetical protein